MPIQLNGLIVHSTEGTDTWHILFPLSLIHIYAMRRAGLGNLYEAFLRLKEQLNAEGLFDPARKREPVPLLSLIHI